MEIDFSQVLMGLMIVSLVVLFASVKWDFPVLSIINRWFRWVLFSLLVSYIVYQLEWTQRSYLVLASTAFLIWFLVETLYVWLGIRVLNYSEAQLFPRFHNNPETPDWPIQPRFIALRDWLRRSGFKEKASLISQVFETVFIRSTVLLDTVKTTRLQILFFPIRGGRYSAYYILTSITESGEYVVTDNIQMPFGGYYPENWDPERKPMTRSLDRLYKRHCERLKAATDAFVAWDDSDPCDDINREQQAIERFNMMEGFLVPTQHQSSHGKISLEGRYQMWKEFWLLRYFGVSPKAHY